MTLNAGKRPEKQTVKVLRAFYYDGGQVAKVGATIELKYTEALRCQNAGKCEFTSKSGSKPAKTVELG